LHDLAAEPPIPGLIGTCGQCMKDVFAFQPNVVIGDFLYHWSCVRCVLCSRGLDADTCVIREGRPTCEKCEVHLWSPACHYFLLCPCCTTITHAFGHIVLF
jgi:hypothetical protein